MNYFGRIKKWYPGRHYGFIYSDIQGSDFFLHESDIASGDPNSLSCGCTLEFQIGEGYDGRVKACEAVITGTLPENESVIIANYEFPLCDVMGFGMCSGEKALEEKNISKEEYLAHGHEYDEVRYIYIATRDDIFRFFPEGSFVHGDGNDDINAVYAFLLEKFLGIMPDTGKNPGGGVDGNTGNTNEDPTKNTDNSSVTGSVADDALKEAAHEL